jgi:hypothetical protein
MSKNLNATTIGAPLNRIDSNDPHEVVHTNLVKGGPKVKDTLAELYAVGLYDRDWGMTGTVLNDGANTGKWVLEYNHVDTDLTNNANWKKDEIELVFDELPTAGSENIPKSGGVKQYIDNAIEGIDRKASARMATTVNIVLNGLQTIDGVVGVAEDPVVVKNQTDATKNGIWTMKAGAWVRRADANTGTELENAYVTVREGTTNVGVTYRQTTKPVTIDVSNIVWDVAGAIISPAAQDVPGITEYADQTEAETALDPVLANRRHDRSLTPKGAGWILDKFKSVSQTFAEIVGFTKGIILGTNSAPADGALWIEGTALKTRIGGVTKILLADVNNLSELSDRDAARKNLGFRTTPSSSAWAATFNWSFLEGLVPQIYDIKTITAVSADFTLNINDTVSGASGIVRLIKSTVNEVKMYLGDLSGTVTHLADNTTDVLPFVTLPAGAVGDRYFGYWSRWDNEFQWMTSDGRALPTEGYSNSDWMTQAAVTNGLNNRAKYGGDSYGADSDIGNNSNFAFILRAFNRQVFFAQQYGVKIVGGDNANTDNILATSLDGTVLFRLFNDRNIGLGPSTNASFGSGKGVLYFANAATVPTGSPTSGIWMWPEGGVLKIKNPNGTIQTSHIWPDTLPANSGIGNPGQAGAAPAPMPFRQIFHKETLTYAYQEDDMPDVFIRTPWVTNTPVTVVSASPTSARTSLIGAALDWGSRTRLGGYFKKGQTIKWDIWGNINFADNTAIIEFRDLMNTVAVASTGGNGTIAGVPNTDKTFHYQVIKTIKSLKSGATPGKIDIKGQVIIQGAATNAPVVWSIPGLTDVDFDDTVDQLFDVDVQWTAPDALSSIKATLSILTIMG